MFFCVFLREFGSIVVSRSLASRSDPGMTLAPARHCMWWLRHHRLRLRLCLASRTRILVLIRIALKPLMGSLARKASLLNLGVCELGRLTVCQAFLSFRNSVL